MEKIKLAETEKDVNSGATLDYYYKYIPLDKEGKIKGKGSHMVRIAGNFYRGGFNISKNKIKAILTYADELKRFAKGEYDTDIDKLKEGEVLKP